MSNKRGRPEKLTREQVAGIVVLHNTGRTYKALAAQYKIPYVSLNAALKRHGLTDKQVKASAQAPVVHVLADAPVALVA
jgi:transposase